MYAASIRLGPWADYLRAAPFKVSWREHLLFAMSSYSALWEDLLLGWIGSAKMIRPGIGEEQRARWTSPSKLSHGTAPFNSRARGEVRAMGCLYHFDRPGSAQNCVGPHSPFTDETMAPTAENCLHLGWEKGGRQYNCLGKRARNWVA